MNSHRAAIPRATAHKRNLQDGGVAITTIKEYLTVQKEKERVKNDGNA